MTIRPCRIALIVSNIQKVFMPSPAADLPRAMAVIILPGINHLAQTIRETGGLVVWTWTAARTSSSVDAAFNDKAYFGERGAEAFYECHSLVGFPGCPPTGADTNLLRHKTTDQCRFSGAFWLY